MTRVLPALAALVAAVSLGACGGASGGGSTSTTSQAAAPSSPAMTMSTTASTPAPAPAPAAQGSSSVRIAGFAYKPARIVVKAGTTVRWTNADSTNHTVTAQDGAFDLGNLASGGGTAQRRFTRPGTYAYICRYHPFMHGTVVVR